MGETFVTEQHHRSPSFRDENFVFGGRMANEVGLLVWSIGYMVDKLSREASERACRVESSEKA